MSVQGNMNHIPPRKHLGGVNPIFFISKEMFIYIFKSLQWTHFNMPICYDQN